MAEERLRYETDDDLQQQHCVRMVSEYQKVV